MSPVGAGFLAGLLIGGALASILSNYYLRGCLRTANLRYADLCRKAAVLLERNNELEEARVCRRTVDRELAEPAVDAKKS